MNILYALLSVGVLVFAILFFTSTDENSVLEGIQQSEGDATTETITTSDGATDTVVDTPASGTVLDRSGEGLNNVPMEIFENTSATTLDVSNNNLDGALQAEVRHLRNLEVLDLSDNNFTGVPAEVGQLTKLRVLDLSNNPITGLPHELGNLQSLELLDLRGTQYSEYDLSIIQERLPQETVIQTD